MRGFTLIELIIVLGVLVIIAGLTIPFFQSFQISSNLNTYSQTLANLIYQARSQAITGQNNSSWGVFFDNEANKAILFQGANYDSRQADSEHDLNYPEFFNVATDFGKEIVFVEFSGRPSANGTITISDSNNQSKIISINSLGLVQVNE